jgi:hypothetical protein
MVVTLTAPRTATADSNLCKRVKGHRRVSLSRGNAAEREQPAEILKAWGVIRKRTEASQKPLKGYRAVPIRLQRPS